MSQATRHGGTGGARRGRVGALVVALAALALTAGQLGTAWGAADEGGDATGDAAEAGAGEPVGGDEVVVVVAEGETMWELVLPHAPAGADPHAFVAEVAARNGVDPGRLEPGTALRVPQW
ncbi:MAG: hypothetical protein ACQETV_01310 [Actinomycetota bacterium]